MLVSKFVSKKAMKSNGTKKSVNIMRRLMFEYIFELTNGLDKVTNVLEQGTKSYGSMTYSKGATRNVSMILNGAG